MGASSKSKRNKKKFNFPFKIGVSSKSKRIKKKKKIVKKRKSPLDVKMGLFSKSKHIKKAEKHIKKIFCFPFKMGVSSKSKRKSLKRQKFLRMKIEMKNKNKIVETTKLDKGKSPHDVKMGVSSKSKRIKKKKKVVGSTRLDNGKSPLDVILGRNCYAPTPTPNEDRDSSSTPPPPVANDPLHGLTLLLHSPNDLAEILERFKIKRAAEIPFDVQKLLLRGLLAEATTPKLEFRAADASARLIAAEFYAYNEQPKSALREAASSRFVNADGKPFLFPFDVQKLLMRGLLGERYVPRWCKLLRFKFISKVALIVVDGVSEAEWNDHVDCFPHLQCMMLKPPVELLPPEVQGNTFLAELFNIPFGMSDMELIDHHDAIRNESHSTTLKERRAESLLGFIDGLEKDSLQRGENKGSEGEAAVTDVATKDDDSEGKLVPLDLESELMAKDGVLTWIDVDHRHDVISRKDLLLTEAEMAWENFPMPYNLPPRFTTEFVPSFESYRGVTASSPLFAVDCEMSMTERESLELTHVAVVDEKLRCVLKSYIKPEAKMKYSNAKRLSGTIAKHLSDSENVMTLKDLQRKLRELLPSDAILVGHSLPCDLFAMRLIHPYVIDTSSAYNLRGFHGQKSKIQDLAYILLDRKIQSFGNNCGKKGHDPLEDAEATMQLALLKLRNGLGFADFTAIENAGKWPGGLKDFIEWYQAVAERQKRKIKEVTPAVSGKEDERNYASAEVDVADAAKNDSAINKPVVDHVEAPSVDGDADGASTSPSPSDHSVRIPPREAFLKRSVADRGRIFRDVFDQLRIEKRGSGAVVDHDDQLEASLKTTTSATKLPAPTDKLIVKEAIRVLPEHFFVCLQLHRYRKLVESETERREAALRKLDKRLKKIYDALPTKSMMVVVFSGRKCPPGGGEEDSSTETEGRKEELSFRHGLVFGGIKTR